MAETAPLRRSPLPHACAVDRPGLRVAQEAWLEVFSLRASAQTLSGVQPWVESLGLALPRAPNTFTSSQDLACAWIEPRAWLLLGPGAAGLRHPAAPAGALLLTDLGHRFHAWRVRGAQAGALIAAASSIGAALHGPGTCARGRFAEETELLVQQLGADDFRLLFDSAHAHFVHDWLIDAAGLQEQISAGTHGSAGRAG